MKKRIFGIILCASLLLSSMNVFAGSAIKWFDKNIAYLTASNGYITASTDVNGSGAVLTKVRPYTPYVTYDWEAKEKDSVSIKAPDYCSGADSYHYVGSSSAYLTVTYS